MKKKSETKSYEAEFLALRAETKAKLEAIEKMQIEASTLIENLQTMCKHEVQARYVRDKDESCICVHCGVEDHLPTATHYVDYGEVESTYQFNIFKKLVPVRSLLMPCSR